MLRTEMVDNLLDSYTMRELKALADKLGLLETGECADAVHDILFDPASSHHEFNKLAEASDEPA